MSKTPRSSSRTYSRSASRSRSASDSRSRSRSSSQSRSRKHRYGSRSRSRSHSPFHNRGRKQPREYQNQREFRGYHRGFRRPYYFRGRGRGFFRGRFQRGGGGGGGYNNYRANNWQNFGQYPQQKQQKQQKQQQVHQPQKQHLHSPKRGRSHTPKKRSSSPQSLSHSHRSDRSSSQHSHHSSSSSSSQQINSSVKQNSKAGIEVLFSSKESQKAGRGDATLPVQDGHHPEVDGSTSQTKPNKTCLFPITHDSSPKRANPHIHSVVRAVQDDPASRDSVSVAGKSGATSNGATYSQPIASTLSTSSPQKKSPTTVFSGFGLFSNADQEEDTVAISIAFKKFLEEQKSKKQALADKTMENMADNGNPFPENRNNKCEGACDRSSVSRLPRPAEPQNKIEDERYKYVDHFKGNTSSSSFRPTVMSEDGEEKDSEHSEPHLENEVSNIKSKIALSARELFEEHLKRLDDRTWDDELEAFLITREKERAASIVSALSKREKFARKFEDLSPERPSKVKRKDTMTLSPSPTYKPISRRSSEIQEQEMLMNVGDESLPRASAKRERDFNLRMDSLSEDLARSSVLSNDWRNTVDHVHCDKKALQYRWCNNLCRSPKELFAQHVISIVHYITEQHFSSSGMTLSDRFTMYQRQAAEKEIMRQRKSPEIHRRIDVSPSAFKRHSFLFDELKGSGDSSSKVTQHFEICHILETNAARVSQPEHL